MNNMYGFGGFGGFGFSELPQLMQLRNMKAEIEALEAQYPDTEKMKREINELEAKKNQRVSVNASKFDMQHEARIRQHAQDERDKLKIYYCPNVPALPLNEINENIQNSSRLKYIYMYPQPTGFNIFRTICFWLALVASIAMCAIYYILVESKDLPNVNMLISYWSLFGMIALLIWAHQTIKRLFPIPNIEWNVAYNYQNFMFFKSKIERSKRTRAILLWIFIGAPITALLGAGALIMTRPKFMLLPATIYTLIFMITSPIAMCSQRKEIIRIRYEYIAKLEKINKEEADSLVEARRLDKEQTILYNNATSNANQSHREKVQAEIDRKRRNLEATYNNYSALGQQIAIKKQYFYNYAVNWGIENYSVGDFDNLIRVMRNHGCSTIMQGKQAWNRESAETLNRIRQKEAYEKFNSDMKEWNRREELRNDRIREDNERQHRERMEAERRRQDEIEKLRKEIERYNRN